MLVPPKFIVSAPGKVILFGEHSVVYGKPVLAASVNKRTSLILEPTTSDSIELKFLKLNLSTSIPADLFIKSDLLIENNAAKSLDENELLKRSETDVDKLPNCQNFDRNQRTSVRCVLYLMHGLLAGRNKLGSFKMTISSDLTVGAGTGSSASFSVCVAAALYHYFRVIYSTNSEDVETSKQFTEEDKKVINAWAFACEQIIHGKASGIDNVVCTYGGIVKMSSSHNEPIIFDDIIPLRVLLVNTRIPRNTADMVKKAADCHSKHSTVVDLIMEAMSEIVSSACSTLNQLKLHQNSTTDNIFRELFSKLECLISLNHGLLVSLGVSHEALDSIVNITKSFNLHSKLTGAGGGGYAITLIPPYTSEDCVQNCIKSLKNSGYEVDDIVVGSRGIFHV